MLLGLVNELPGALGTGYGEGTAPPSLTLVFVAQGPHRDPAGVQGRESWHIMGRARLQEATGLQGGRKQCLKRWQLDTALAGYHTVGRTSEEEGLLFEVCGVLILSLALELHRIEDHVQLIAIP